MLSALTGRPAAAWYPVPKAALLTRRRPIDYCRVAASLCPPVPRLRRVP